MAFLLLLVLLYIRSILYHTSTSNVYHKRASKLSNRETGKGEAAEDEVCNRHLSLDCMQ